MFFGQEGERLEQKRAEQRSQYAADLKRQIEEQGKPSVLRQNGQNSVSSPYRVIDDSPPKNYQSFATKTFMDDDPRAQSPRRHVNEREEPDNSYYSQPPSYQSSNSQNNQASIDRILNYELPMKLKPLEDAITNLNTKLNRSNANSNDLFSTIRDKISELQMNMTKLSQKTEENTLKIKYLSSEMSERNHKYQEAISSSQNNQINNNNVSAMEEDIIALTKWQTNIEQSINSSIEQINRMILDVSQKSYDSDLHIMQQMENMNKQTAYTFGKVSTCISSIQDSIISMNNDINQLNNAVNLSSTDLKNRVQTYFVNNSQALDIIQSEFIQTSSNMHDFISQQLKSLEEALCGEVNARKSAISNNEIPNNEKANDSQLSNVKEIVNNEFKGYFETIMNRIDEYENNVEINYKQTQQKVAKINNNLVDMSYDDSELRGRIEFLEERLISQSDGRPKTSDQAKHTLSNSKNFAKPVVKLLPMGIKPKSDDHEKIFETSNKEVEDKLYEVDMEGISVRDSLQDLKNIVPKSNLSPKENNDRPDSPLPISPKKEAKLKEENQKNPNRPKVSFILPNWFTPPKPRDANYYAKPIYEENDNEPPFELNYDNLESPEEEEMVEEEEEEVNESGKPKSPVKPPDEPNEGKPRRPKSPRKGKNKSLMSKSINNQFMIAQKIKPIKIDDFDGNSSLQPIEMMQFTPVQKD
ncbi:hypothetical protein TVAG_345890 [Trichomonas vaginalis G3]|uniref:Uncharacterized protein n=1 Tax=Trichomonas vaginalis (strain ATCC PRA-98 / G3) TaxID=412133 RepID=A2F4X6_TRIV3|nr:uncharacterized protein TVAGG3_1069870 [Trichomonas vaginalis G3]EAY00041.1 hypothetical protein TVAG_345890 [Trichomonas vaginalis G3]KAI5483103.1 hypothetical protein TVAGG3_1069870 [Trichomonas vaginalis G3]|eukprot:XP_001312970.1 hypothetical protein [Trichomonas vaginalis G3]